MDERIGSESVRIKVDDEVRRIAEECYSEALNVLRGHRENLDALAEALLRHETLDEAAAYEAAGFPRPERKADDEPVVTGATGQAIV